MKKKIYEQAFKNKMIRLHLEEGRTISSLNKEYQLGSGTLNNWIKAYREQCMSNPIKEAEKDVYEVNRELRKKLEELEKENRFLKKAAAFFAKEID